MLARGVADAFDLSDENPRLLERYDTGELEPSDEVKKRNGYATQFSPVALGRQMLMARRLCEAGCGFVTVTCGGWDMHGGGKEFTMQDGLASLTPAIDKAVSAFIEDVNERGLSGRILLVTGTKMVPPVPATLNAVLLVGHHLGRSNPKVIVQAVGWVSRGLVADIPTPLDVPRLGDKHRTDHSIVEHVNRFDHGRGTSHLGAMLHDALVLPGRLHQHPPLPQIV